MVAEILKNDVNTIIVERLDRLAREYRIQETLLIYMAAKNINLISADTGECVTEAIKGDPMRRAMVQMQGVFAELEKSVLIKKLRKARETKRERTGKCEGRKSYSEIAPGIVREIRKLRRKRGSRKRTSYKTIAQLLNERGLRTVSGGEFTLHNTAQIFLRNS